MYTMQGWSTRVSVPFLQGNLCRSFGSRQIFVDFTRALNRVCLLDAGRVVVAVETPKHHTLYLVDDHRRQNEYNHET